MSSGVMTARTMCRLHRCKSGSVQNDQMEIQSDKMQRWKLQIKFTLAVNQKDNDSRVIIVKLSPGSKVSENDMFVLDSRF